ncbi:hypothetical protein [Halostagnicola larsenii]|uniref:hypothetical protein n=1 Tax=Halostagnicola larsenii TaxID=353800 RepID=UPI0012FC85E5|nr:hypothetical protein [Halostagnicola larsenii]
MKRRTTLSTIAGAIVGISGIGTAAAANSVSAPNSRRGSPSVKISDEAIGQAQSLAESSAGIQANNSVGIQSVDNRETNAFVARHSNRQKSLLKQSKETSDNWEAFITAREAAMNGFTAEGYQKGESEDISEESIINEVESIRSKLKTTKKDIERQPSNKKDLIVQGEIQHSLNSALDHLEQVPELFESGDEPKEICLAQAYSSIKAASMNVSDSKHINNSNPENTDNSSAIEGYEKAVSTTSANLTKSYNSNNYASIVAESADGYRSQTQTMMERGLTEVAFINSIKSDAMRLVAGDLTSIPNPWVSKKRVTIEATNERARTARTSIQQTKQEIEEDPLTLELLDMIDSRERYANSMLETSKSKKNPEDTQSLVIALANYKIAESLSNNLGDILESTI